MFKPSEVAPKWPTRPDGSSKIFGELTEQEQKDQVYHALVKLQKELEHPALAEILLRVDTIPASK